MLKVISLGNVLRGDDSIGPRIIEELRNVEIPVPVTLIDAGADAFALLDHLTGSDPILVIDCAQMGKEPGWVEKFTLDKATLNKANESISLHGFSLAEIYAMAGAVGPISSCTIIGVQPKSIAFGESLSDEVAASIPEIINLVIEEAKKNGE